MTALIAIISIISIILLCIMIVIFIKLPVWYDSLTGLLFILFAVLIGVIMQGYDNSIKQDLIVDSKIKYECDSLGNTHIVILDSSLMNTMKRVGIVKE